MSMPLFACHCHCIGNRWSVVSRMHGYTVGRRISRVVLLINYVLIGFSHTNSVFNMQVHGQTMTVPVCPCVRVWRCSFTLLHMCLLFPPGQKQINTLFSRLTATVM